LYDTGAKLLAGTDTFLPTLVPGFSLHEELKEFVGIRLTPYEALLTSTTHPFEYLGELDSYGTVEINKFTNLVLLEDNPLEDISNTRNIAGVMINGSFLSKEDLQNGLDTLATNYNN